MENRRRTFVVVLFIVSLYFVTWILLFVVNRRMEIEKKRSWEWLTGVDTNKFVITISLRTAIFFPIQQLLILHLFWCCAINRIRYGSSHHKRNLWQK